MPKDDEEDEHSCERNIYGSTESLPVSALKMQVILRIRPASPPVGNKNHVDIYAVENPTTLLVKNLTPNETARRSKANEKPTFKKFKFDQIFNLQIGQSQFFNEAVKPSVVDFLNSLSCTVISYGSAEAGKTYTLFGTACDAGVIPRSIQFIFSSIHCTLSPWYKPDHSQAVVHLDEPDRALEIEVREKLLSCPLIDKTMCERAYEALQDSEADNNRDIIKDSMFALWISFIEIYNETVFDLLEVDEEGKKSLLKLSTDKSGSTYVQGMRSVCATTGLEAYEILNAGQMRLSTVSASNYKSSRSHAIFTMRLLKYEKDCAPSEVQMSTISFYDLAGPGKIQKSSDNDKQLKESRSINTSLLAFGRCLKALLEGHSRQSIGPFRDSKLTRLFQHSLRKENFIILVNLNPTFELFAETQNVLNFASTAIKLTSEFAKEDKRLLDYQSPVSSPKVQQTRSSAPLKSLGDQEISEIVEKNKQLLNEIKNLKSTELNREYKLRQDLADFYAKQLNDLEEIWKNRMSVAEEEKEYLLKFSVDRVESYYKSKLGERLNRKPRRIDRNLVENTSDSTSSHNVHHSKVTKLKKTIKSLKEENEKLTEQSKQHTFETSWLKDCLKRMSDFVGASHGQYNNELLIDDFSTEIFECTDDDIISHLRSITAVLKETFGKDLIVNGAQEPSLSTRAVQCDIDFSLLGAYCDEIEALFRQSEVSLPQINDSLDQKTLISNHLSVVDLTERLSKIKESIAEHIFNRTDLEIENDKKEEELRSLRTKVEQQDAEILQLRQQCAESESSRLSLLKKCESIEMACKSREFFKNPDFDAVESENSLTCVLHHEISLEQGAHDDSLQLSLLESNADQTGSNATRSSSGSSKNDSGLALSMDSVNKLKVEKDSQTELQHEEDQNRNLKEKLMQLNLDYSRMEAQHLQGSTRITELSMELERIGEAMTYLKENTYIKDRTISECQSRLNDSKLEIERLNEEKRQLEKKFEDLRDNLVTVSRDYEKKLTDSEVKLRVYEEGENRTARCLKDYWEESVNLGSELSVAYSELEKFSIRCYKDHILKIQRLEEELAKKTMSLTDLNEQISAFQKDLSKLTAISKKVDDFESILSQIRKEKVEVDQILIDRSEAQSLIQNQLENLTEKIGARDDQILELKWQLDAIIQANLSNSRQAKELGKEVTKLTEKLCVMKGDIVQSETARTELERKSVREIDNLRARLTIFEGNADLLNLMHSTEESKQCDIDKLKLKVLEKEKELEFLKKNRNSTIQRYECLVEQLRNALKMNNHSHRTKKPHKRRYFFNDLKETTSCHVYDSNLCVGDWQIDEKEKFLLPRSSKQMFRPSSVGDSRMTASKEEPSRLLSKINKNRLEASNGVHSVSYLSHNDLDTTERSFEISCRAIDKYFVDTRSRFAIIPSSD